MDQKYFEEIKVREQAATPGPWHFENNYGEYVRDKDGINVCMMYNLKNFDFISHARDDIPALIEQHEQDEKQIATLKKALELACEEVTKHTSECPASLYGAEMCENCNDDDCDSNRLDRWNNYFIHQAQEQDGGPS